MDTWRSDEVHVEHATSMCATDVAVQHGRISLTYYSVVGHAGIPKYHIIPYDVAS